MCGILARNVKLRAMFSVGLCSFVINRIAIAHAGQWDSEIVEQWRTESKPMTDQYDLVFVKHWGGELQ
jgi:hypothetical protein